MTTKTRPFKTEVQHLLDLVIHSLYSKKEIFLRELISNASDAMDRVKFEALTASDLLGTDETWAIRIKADKTARTLTITDNGVGMSADEVDQNIGTIANSGTRNFLDSVREKQDAADVDFIGQFGVGFYAAFMVADQVTLVTRRAGKTHAAVKWVSDGTGTYTIEETEKAERGTEITLHLREGMDEYLDPWRIREIVKQYSDYIAYPIVLTPESDAPQKDGKAAEPETLNSQKAIWRKDKKDLSAEDYNEFYTHITHDHHAPLEVMHYAVEGTTEFRALLYLPKQAPFDLFMRDRQPGLQLYVKNVLIDPDCKVLLPEYLRFVKGVVDSSDLPLNVSREMLQDDALPRQIRRNLVGKVLATLKELMEKRPDEYRDFFVQFGKVLKEGLASGDEDQDKLKELLLFATSKTQGADLISLKQYVGRMPVDQKEIYYLTADSLPMAQQSPHLEVLRSKDREVLFWVDPIDSWIADHVREFDGKKLRPIDRGDFTIEGAEALPPKESHAALLEQIQKALESDVQTVRFTNRLSDSACCLVTDDRAMSPTMERMMRAMNQVVPKSKRILEINPAHPLVARMQGLLDQDASGHQLKDYTELMYGQALLQEGTPLPDPARFVKLVSSLMVQPATTT